MHVLYVQYKVYYMDSTVAESMVLMCCGASLWHRVHQHQPCPGRSPSPALPP